MKLLNNEEVCIILNISTRTLQRYRCTGQLAFKRIGQKTYYSELDVQMFILKYCDK
jgi:predicted site-specific integrase-resolvase